MASARELRIASLLRAPREEVWERVTSAQGINYELRPWLRMTIPAGVQRLDLDSVELGRRIGRSWVLLFGVLPVDYDDLTLVRLDPGEGFLERSPMLSMSTWEHERTLSERGETSCELRDRILFRPRLSPAMPLAFFLLRRFFGHRHRRLRRYFGGEASTVVD